MARNPLMNNPRIDAQSNGMTHDPAAVNPYKDWVQRNHQFNNSYRHATTERYADISPFMAFDALPKDNIPFSLELDTNSYTLKTPTLPDVTQHRFYSIVPYKAILPDTWKLFYVNPTHGDDVPDDVYCNLNVLKWWYRYYYNIKNASSLPGTQFVEFIIATESIFSVGSLFAKFKANLWPFLYKDRSVNFDNWFNNSFVPFVTDNLQIDRLVGADLAEPIACNDESFPNARIVSVNTFLDILRSGKYLNLVPGPEFWSSLQTLGDDFVLFVDSIVGTVLDVDSLGYDIDLSRFIAYQITCISQYSDSSIDYLFNADLFRNNFSNGNYEYFEYNDMTIRYDVFSKHMLEADHVNTLPGFISFCQHLFTYQQSLKFGDYFTTARPEPLANGDIDVDPNGDGSINALETARKLVYTRYLNWNNRVGPKYEDYVKGLTGLDAFPEDTDAAPITHQSNPVGSYRVENTGSQQFDAQSVTSLIRDHQQGREFDIFVTQPSIVLGLSSYDCERLYTRIMDRANLKDSRFDFFNERLQYTGDQPILACELNALRSNTEPIAYTTKDMHYKMQVSHATGGFLINLPSWAFTTEESDMDDELRLGINPFFIRNINSDFDRFYGSLSGHSLGTYFHFVQKYNNILPTSRAMDVAPDIL